MNGLSSSLLKSKNWDHFSFKPSFSIFSGLSSPSGSILQKLWICQLIFISHYLCCTFFSHWDIFTTSCLVSLPLGSILHLKYILYILSNEFQEMKICLKDEHPSAFALRMKSRFCIEFYKFIWSFMVQLGFLLSSYIFRYWQPLFQPWHLTGPTGICTDVSSQAFGVNCSCSS